MDKDKGRDKGKHQQHYRRHSHKDSGWHHHQHRRSSEREHHGRRSSAQTEERNLSSGSREPKPSPESEQEIQRNLEFVRKSYGKQGKEERKLSIQAREPKPSSGSVESELQRDLGEFVRKAVEGTQGRQSHGPQTHGRQSPGRQSPGRQSQEADYHPPPNYTTRKSLGSANVPDLINDRPSSYIIRRNTFYEGHHGNPAHHGNHGQLSLGALYTPQATSTFQEWQETFPPPPSPPPPSPPPPRKVLATTSAQADPSPQRVTNATQAPMEDAASQQFLAPEAAANTNVTQYLIPPLGCIQTLQTDGPYEITYSPWPKSPDFCKPCHNKPLIKIRILDTQTDNQPTAAPFCVAQPPCSNESPGFLRSQRAPCAIQGQVYRMFFPTRPPEPAPPLPRGNSQPLPRDNSQPLPRGNSQPLPRGSSQDLKNKFPLYPM